MEGEGGKGGKERARREQKWREGGGRRGKKGGDERNRREEDQGRKE